MQETMEEMEKRLGASVVRYVKDLDMREVSKLPPQAQNVFSLMLAEWGKMKTITISIPVSVLRHVLNIKDQSKEYVRAQIAKLNASIVLGSYVMGECEEGTFHAVLIPLIIFDEKRQVIEATCLPQFLDVFIKLNEGYTEYKTAMFLRCKSKYAKNLFRIFSKNFKGKCTLSMDDLKVEMGAPAKSRNPDILRIVDRAVKELRQTGIYEYVDYSPNIDTGRRGHPLISISFKFEISKERIAELHGQERLPGLDIGAAGAPTAQAAARDDPFHTTNEQSRDMTHQPSAADVMAALAANGQPVPKKKEDAPVCPRCGKPMTLRTANGTGKKFWGCTGFPKCRGSLDYSEEN